MPPLDQTYDALLLLGVYLPPEKNPPKTWNEYLSLLSTRLRRQLMKCSDDRMWIEEELVESGWLLEKPATVEELIYHLLDSDRLACNELVSRWRSYLTGAGQPKEELLKTRKTELEVLKMSQAQKKFELDEYSPAEWWDKLQDCSPTG